ncbi:MAG: hypothetical protein BMS9Abin20_0126 [Acidimicrobiia bacterium]|nr:MAG: hypothetical protein BMS9Abin20_0126 [Acidimicrobiia bacterium]
MCEVLTHVPTSGESSLLVSVDVLRQELLAVPDLLLSNDDRAVISDALTSLDVMGRIASRSAVVVLVGPSGSGRSFIFNMIVGLNASPEGALRPTTTGIVASGSGESGAYDADGRYTIAPEAPSGFVFLDTPGWEHDPDTVRSTLTEADLVLVVVSPSRYGDASVASLWAEVREANSRVILNRVRGDEQEQSTLLESVRGIFDTGLVVVGEGETDPVILRKMVAASVGDRGEASSMTIMSHAAGSAARFIAGTVTSSAPEIGAVRRAVEGLPLVSTSMPPLAVHDSWLATKQAAVEMVARTIRDRDDDIVRGSKTHLGQRILDRLGRWDGATLDADLDLWRVRCVDIHMQAASIRWRRRAAERMVERLAWKSAINDGVVLPERFLRIMGKQRAVVTDTGRDELSVLIAGSVEERRVGWLNLLSDLGNYQPGDLAGAADAMDSARRIDD